MPEKREGEGGKGGTAIEIKMVLNVWLTQYQIYVLLLIQLLLLSLEMYRYLIYQCKLQKNAV